MSYWTSVNGALVIDRANELKSNTLVGLRALFKTAQFYSTAEEWDACNVPCGKEGSLYVNTWKNPRPDYTPRFTIHFFGNLRGYDESQHKDIILWIDKIIQDNELCVSDGVLTINEKVYRYIEHFDDTYDIIKSGFELVSSQERYDYGK